MNCAYGMPEQKLSPRAKAMLEAHPDMPRELIIQYKKEKMHMMRTKHTDAWKHKRVRAERMKLARLHADMQDIERVELDQDITTKELTWNVERVAGMWTGAGGSGVTVAVLDTGFTHDDLAVTGWNVLLENQNSTDTNGHGTSVASVVHAVAPETAIVPVKIMNTNIGSLSDAIAGLSWAIEQEVDVAVLSFGFPERSEIFNDLVQEAYDNGMLLVGASGNDGGPVLYPAAYDDVIAVGATESDDTLAGFSNRGFSQELVAPGVDVPVMTLTGYGTATGTSLAAPHVAGVAALFLSEGRSSSDTRASLRSGALDLAPAGKDSKHGFGLVQAVLADGEVNDSYSYDVYNVTDYGLESETIVYWTSGVGTIDNLSFADGVYIVTRDGVNSTMIVGENGSVGTLAVGGDLLFFDSYTVDGTDMDGALWVGDTITIGVDPATTPLPFSVLDGECHSGDGDPSSNFDACWFDTATKRDDCDAHTGFVHCGSITSCNIDDVGENRTGIVDTSSTLYQNQRARLYDNCFDTVPDFWTTNERYVLVMDEKRSTCVNSTHYAYEGRYTGSNWAAYHTDACPGSCVQGLTTTESSRNIPLSPPCDGCVGSGVVRAIVAVDGSAAVGYPVRLNNVYVGETDSVGTLDMHVGATGCSVAQDVTVYCQDNTTVCGTDSTWLGALDDTDSMLFDCTLACGSGNDLYMEQAAIVVAGTTVTVGVSSVGVTASNVAVRVVRGTAENFFAETREDTISVTPGTVTDASVTFNELADGDVLRIWLDDTHVVANEDNTNNYVERQAFKDVKVHIDFDLPPQFSVLEDIFTEYIGSVAEIVTPGAADVLLEVKTYKKPFFGGKKFVIDGEEQDKPFAVRISKEFTGKQEITVEGKDIEGVIVGLKRFVERMQFFAARGNEEVYLKDTDPFGVRIFDQLVADGTNIVRDNSPAARALVRDVLFDQNFEVAIKPVKTPFGASYPGDVLLRVKHVNADVSEDYREAFGVSTNPVVFSGGLFSNIEAWEGDGGLAAQMAREGWDVWSIEMTGGPNTECDTCPNYTYSDLVDFHWPASIAGVMTYADTNKIDYVGHSNGCRAALSSLHEYSNSGKNSAGYYLDETGSFAAADLPALPVDRFVGVGCPSVLNEESTFTTVSRISRSTGEKNGDFAIRKTSSKKHVNLGDYSKWLVTPDVLLPPQIIGDDIARVIFWTGATLVSPNKISHNLMNFYSDLAVNPSSSLNFNGVNVSELHLFATKMSDIVVPINDSYDIEDDVKINQDDKSIIVYELQPFETDHVFIKDFKEFIDEAKVILK